MSEAGHHRSPAAERDRRSTKHRIVARVAVFLLMAGLNGIPAVARADVAFPAPDWMTQTAVADQMVINGLPSVVHHFEAARPLDELLAFYRRCWDERHAGRAGYREVTVDPWHVVSRLEGRYLMTVQAREKDALACEGYLAVADLKKIRAPHVRDERVPQLEGSRVINDTTGTDPGRKGRTLMIVNSFSVDRNREFYRDHFVDRGWRPLQDQANEDAHVLVFRRLGAEAHIVIQPSRTGAVAVMTLVTPD